MNDIEKATPEEALSMILSFNDANLVSMLFEKRGWSLSEEIKETLSVARQNVNLGAKMTALKHLRTLVKEAAEASGYIAKVSTTIPSEDGSHTTFSANRIAAALNPKKPKKIESIQGDSNDKEERKPEQEPERNPVEPVESDGGRSASADRGRDSETGNGRSEDGRSPETRTDSKYPDSFEFPSAEDTADRRPSEGQDRANISLLPEGGENPCIQHRPPTCERRLYPGVSGTGSPEG